MIGTAWSLLLYRRRKLTSSREMKRSILLFLWYLWVPFNVTFRWAGFDGFLVCLTNHTVVRAMMRAYGLIHCLSIPWNVGILVFLVVLGSIVSPFDEQRRLVSSSFPGR